MIELTPAKTAAEVIAFWRDAGPDRWFTADSSFDEQVRARLLPLHEAAAAGDLADWRGTPDGNLALLILLDQAPRNMFRHDRRAYATDAKALQIARSALSRKHDAEVDPALRRFFYLPFMHSEDMADLDRCVALYQHVNDDDGVTWAILHRDIIARFGRYPHRNGVLGRPSTPQEISFLADPDSFKG